MRPRFTFLNRLFFLTETSRVSRLCSAWRRKVCNNSNFALAFASRSSNPGWTVMGVCAGSGSVWTDSLSGTGGGRTGAGVETGVGGTGGAAETGNGTAAVISSGRVRTSAIWSRTIGSTRFRANSRASAASVHSIVIALGVAAGVSVRWRFIRCSSSAT